MIKPGIIQQKARNVGVRDQQIEKDYVLSWILQGIAQLPYPGKRLGDVLIAQGLLTREQFNQAIGKKAERGIQSPNLNPGL